MGRREILKQLKLQLEPKDAEEQEEDESEDESYADTLKGKAFLSIQYDGSPTPDLYVVTEEMAIQVIKKIQSHFLRKVENPTFLVLSDKSISNCEPSEFLDELKGCIRIDNSIRAIKVITPRRASKQI